MKRVSFVFLSLIMAITVQAQDVGYTGPAESEVKSFWINAMGIQKTKKYAEGAAVLEAKLKKVKEKDPAYKTDQMEAEINKWKSKAGNETAAVPPANDFANMNPVRKALLADELLRKLFDEINISVPVSSLPVIENRFKEYNGKLQQYTELNTQPKASDIRRTKAIIEKHIYATNKDIVTIEDSRKYNLTPDDAEVNFYLAKYNQLYWEAAVKIFPEETSFAAEYKVITDFINKIGSLEEMKAGMNKNNLEKIKSRKLPAPVVKDARLEKVLTDGFNKKFSTSGKVSAIKAVLTQDGWTTLRHTVSGAIIGRERSARIAYRGSDGKCYLLPGYVFIHEDYTGGSFSNTTAIFNGLDGDEMLCENAR